jgi:ABC-type multidrug transport system fused ATPase/permease subunit
MKKTVPALIAKPAGASVLLRRVIREQAFRYWKSYALALFCMAVMAVSISGAAYLIRNVVDATYVTRDFGAVFLLCATTVSLFSLRGLAQYAQGTLIARAQADMTAQNRKAVVARLLAENMEFLSGSHSAEIVRTIEVSAPAPAQAIDLMVTSAGRDGLALLGLSAVMIYQDVFMSLICVACSPIAFLVVRNSRARLQLLGVGLIRAESQTSEIMHEILRGIRIIKTFVLERATLVRAAQKIDLVKGIEQELAHLMRRPGLWIEMLSGCVVSLILFYGSYRYIVLGSGPGEFVSFLAAFMLAYDPAKRLARFPVDLTSALIGIRMFYDWLDGEPTEPADDKNPELVVHDGRIALQDVTFGYRNGAPVLRKLSLTAMPGEVTALVGNSGGGKSTILGLILRLYECQHGTISIDGQQIADVSRLSVRRQIAYLGQDIFLFHGSIAENIRVGRPGASHDEIVFAARAAYAHDFITSFPQGYDTPVGEHGLKLSSGQRQRVAIARAFLKDAPIVLLDEPTAALDMASEREVQRAIAELCVGRTTLVVAHRLHTIVAASTIYVIGDGQVLEVGDHHSLLANGTVYRNLHDLRPEKMVSG